MEGEGEPPGTARPATTGEVQVVQPGVPGGPVLAFSLDRVVGQGSFGVVYVARLEETGEMFAIKKVLQDKRFKNRELQIMRMVSHRNIVAMRHCFHCPGERDRDEVYLNLVLEYVPETVFRFCRSYVKARESVPIIYVKLYTYQLLRALHYLTSPRVAVCHRDIKPQNLLVDAATGVLKLCDFGSAKQLVPGERNVSYICSRYYRAPELIFGAEYYTPAIDVWSVGCVFAELMLGSPLFPGESRDDQLVEIVKVLGTPSREEVDRMNAAYVEFKFPPVKPHPLNKLFRRSVPPEAIDLLGRMLRYTPSERILPYEGMAHPFFDDLRNADTRLPSGRRLPELFDWTPEELDAFPAGFASVLTPPWAGTLGPASPSAAGGGLPSPLGGLAGSGLLPALTAPHSSSADVRSSLPSGTRRG